MIKLGERELLYTNVPLIHPTKFLDPIGSLLICLKWYGVNRFRVFDNYGVKSTIVEVPIPDHDPIDNLHGIEILIKLGLKFDEAQTNSAMTHVLVFDC